MRFRKIFLLVLAICLLLSLSSCFLKPEEEMPETLECPEENTMLEYRLGEDECLRVLYTEIPGSFYGYCYFGEWIKNGEEKKVCICINEKYWGILFSRNGITELTLSVHKLTLGAREWDGSYRLDVGEEIARTDEGFLNSTTLTMTETGEALNISDIKVTENYEGDFDWATPEWKAFCVAEENEVFEMEKLSLWCDGATKTGEWITNGVAVPVRIAFDKWLPAVEVFDISGEEEKRIFLGNGHLEDGVLVIDDYVGNMVYGNTVTDLTLTKAKYADPFLSQEVRESWKTDLIVALSRSRSYEDIAWGCLGTGLMDLNFDNTPELLVVYSGGSMGNIFTVIYSLSDGEQLCYYNAPHDRAWDDLSLCVLVSEDGRFLTVGEGAIRPEKSYLMTYVLNEQFETEWLFGEAPEEGEYWCGERAVEKDEYLEQKDAFEREHRRIEETKLQLVYWKDLDTEDREIGMNAMATALLATSQKFIDFSK